MYSITDEDVRAGARSRSGKRLRFVVAGSLADQGGAVARLLKEHGHDVVALWHDPRSPSARRLAAAGVEVIGDDLGNAARTAANCRGAAGLFAALTPFDRGGREAELGQLDVLAGAAAWAGVPRVVYSSVGDPDRDRDGDSGALWEAERLLVERGLPLTIFRPAFFMENLSQFALGRFTGLTLRIQTPLPDDVLLQWIATRDVALFVEVALLQPERFDGRPVELGGDELTFWDATMLVASHARETVGYARINMKTVARQSGHLLGMYRWFELRPLYRADISALRTMHPGMLTFAEWLKTGGLALPGTQQAPLPLAA